MKIDPAKHYNMPLLMGPLFDRSSPPRYVYQQAEVLGFQYLTDPIAVEALLPRWYRPGKEPLVTVLFSHYKGISFMAGGGYYMAAIMVEARFDGERDHVTGDYILVMFENQAWPIIGGREDIGIPMLYADISNIKIMPDGHMRCDASWLGHFLFGLDVPPLNNQVGVMRVIASRQINAQPWLVHKYIPSLDDVPDADYPVIFKKDTKIQKLSTGKRASLRFGTAKIEDISFMRNLMEKLAILTVIRPVQVMHFHGSMVDRYDLCKRLR